MKINIKSSLILLSFMLLSISNSGYLINRGFNTYVEYIAFGILLLENFCCIIKKGNLTKKGVIRFLVILMLFSIGLLLQDLNISIKIKLLISMLLIEIFLLFSGNILNDFKLIRTASYGLFIGTIITSIIALITNTSLLEKIYGNSIFDYGFNGGIIYKNYYAAILVVCFIGVFISHKENNKRKIDYILFIVIFLLLVLSSSKGALVLFLIFITLELFFNNRKKVKNNVINYKGVNHFLFMFLIIVGVIIGLIILFKFVLPKSSTYSYRIRGVNNYLILYKNDLFHLIFGNAEMAYRDKNQSYVTNIRTFLTAKGLNGYDGSYEMGFINVLIKNGIMGIIGFAYSYIVIINRAKSLENKIKLHVYIIFFTLMISSLVESYVCNIHAIFGITCYMFINGLIKIENDKNKENRKYD